MTPRKLNAWAQLASKRQRRGYAHDLTIIALGSRGKPEALKEELNRLIG